MSGENKLARPYAKALFSLAQKDQSYAHWAQMLRVAKDIAAHPKIVALLKSPTLSLEQKLDFFAGVGGELFDETMRRFLQILSDNKRLLVLPAIFELFDAMQKEALSQIDVTLTAAMPVPADSEQKLKRALEQRLKKQVNLLCETDPQIIGGAIIRAGDWVIDGSVRGKLAQIYDAIGIS